MRDVAIRGGEVDVKAANAEDDWNLEGMVSASKLATPGVREKLQEIQQIYKDGNKAVPTFVLEVNDLSRKVVETKRDIAKLLGCTNDLMIEMDDNRESKRLACHRVQKAKNRVEALEEHVDAADLKYSKSVEIAAQVEKEFCTRVMSLVPELKTEKAGIARFVEDRINEHSEDREAAVERQRAINVFKNDLRDKVKTLRQVRS